ncbi:MAG: GIY-YIG nuclease family protein [Eubacteriales bacterium]|nr:GIY-YIG nuclease family protein [Eubacteriales bacterium]
MKPQNKKDLIEAYKQRKQIGGIYAVTNRETGKALVLATAEIGGIQQRYEFAEMTGGCFHPKLQQDAKTYGNNAFSFAVLETIERKNTQTDREFAEDLEVLLAMWLEKYDPATLY